VNPPFLRVLSPILAVARGVVGGSIGQWFKSLEINEDSGLFNKLDNSAINVSTMPNFDDSNQKLPISDFVNNTISSSDPDSIQINRALQFFATFWTGFIR
jgi:hypothetical protein